MTIVYTWNMQGSNDEAKISGLHQLIKGVPGTCPAADFICIQECGSLLNIVHDLNSQIFKAHNLSTSEMSDAASFTGAIQGAPVKGIYYPNSAEHGITDYAILAVNSNRLSCNSENVFLLESTKLHRPALYVNIQAGAPLYLGCFHAISGTGGGCDVPSILQATNERFARADWLILADYNIEPWVLAAKPGIPQGLYIDENNTVTRHKSNKVYDYCIASKGLAAQIRRIGAIDPNASDHHAVGYSI